MEQRYMLKDESCILKKGQNIECNICMDAENAKKSHKLFFTCEDTLWPQAKNESGAELLYMLIDDSLNYDQAEMNRYCLDMSCDRPYPFAKRIMKKVVWQPLIYGLYPYEDFCAYNSSWCVGVWAKAENLKVLKNGFLHVRLDRWNKREGSNVRSTKNAPDETIIIDIPEGTYKFTEIKKEITIEENTACVIVTIEGENYSGNVYFENPFLNDFEGRNMLPEFDRGSLGLKSFAWFGQNLSKREWPNFEISVNGKTVFDGEYFLKVHRFSPIEFELPNGSIKEGENTISIKYKSDYIDTIPLNIDKIILLEKEKTLFSLVNPPKDISTSEDVKLLIETEDDELDIIFESDDFCLKKEKVFKGLNLRVLTLSLKKAENNLSFTLKCKDETKNYTVLRSIKKEKDNIIAGSGDMIYVDITNLNDVCSYVKWYVENEVGRLITIRPVYRWGGQRFVNPKVWEIFTSLCEEIGLFYVNISDGRDIPGISANPSFDMLKGKNFLGRQLHERDGQLFYWSPAIGRPREVNAEMEEFFDLALRKGREEPETLEGALREFNISYYDTGYSSRRDFSQNDDMKEIHDIVAQEINDLCRDDFTRHTGPSVMFKYFYQNGFDWLGAETMDGATEMLLAFLRGASFAYNKEKYGVHLALQWSTFPHDTIQRYKRYLLSLYIPYMHGVTDINTEEGLWFIEARYAYYNRLSDVCEKHREQKRRFNKFIRTHSRTGTFYTPVAFLHGRMDGWNGFFAWNIWGMPSMKRGDESPSWKLLSHFYPLNSIEDYGMGKTGCILPDNDKPFGLFSGTPNGQVDAVPVEDGDLSRYSVLIFAGYNAADDNSLDRLYEFVRNGGTLVCAWPHFSDTTNKSDIENYKLNIIDHKLTKILCSDVPEFKSDLTDGKEVKVCSNINESCIVTEKTDGGMPLVCSFNVEKGRIILVNTLYYPGHESVFPVYNNVVSEVNEEVRKGEKISVKCDVDVQYTVFKQKDGSMHYYFTAVDWYNNSEDKRKAEISLGGFSYSLEMEFGEIVKLVTDGKIAVWPESDETEIISVFENGFCAQGYAKQNIFVAMHGKTEVISVDFGDDYMKEIKW